MKQQLLCSLSVTVACAPQQLSTAPHREVRIRENGRGRGPKKPAYLPGRAVHRPMCHDRATPSLCHLVLATVLLYPLAAVDTSLTCLTLMEWPPLFTSAVHEQLRFCPTPMSMPRCVRASPSPPISSTEEVTTMLATSTRVRSCSGGSNVRLFSQLPLWLTGRYG